MQRDQPAEQREGRAESSQEIVTSGYAVRASSTDNASEIAKIIVTSGLKFIPYVGGILSGLVGFLWPSSGPSTWEQIREEVEALIDQKINEAVFNLLQAKLSGLGNASKLYLNLLQKRSGGDAIATQWIATNTLYVAAAPEFMNKNYEWTIGPLFSIFAVLHMTLLRDAVLHGPSWGWNDHEYRTYAQLAKDTLDKYLQYFDQVLNNREKELQRSAPTKLDGHRTNIYNYWQPFRLQSVVGFDDYRILVKYLDAFEHPGPTTEFPFKDAYSRACGTADDWDATANAMSGTGGVDGAYSVPLRSFNQIYLEFFNYGPRIVDLTYNNGQGPRVKGGDRADKVRVISQVVGGVEKSTISFPDPGKDKMFNISHVRIRHASIPLAISLFLDNGTEKWLFDKHVNPGGTNEHIRVDGRKLTTFNMWTLSRFYHNNMACIIFGFSRDTKEVPPTVLRQFYINEVGDLPEELERRIKDEDKEGLKKERETYWKHVRAIKNV